MMNISKDTASHALTSYDSDGLLARGNADTNTLEEHIRIVKKVIENQQTLTKNPNV